jgi:hypothetical protein
LYGLKLKYVTCWGVDASAAAGSDAASELGVRSVQQLLQAPSTRQVGFGTAAILSFLFLLLDAVLLVSL